MVLSNFLSSLHTAPGNIVNVNIEDTLKLRRGIDSGLENSNERVQ